MKMYRFPDKPIWKAAFCVFMFLMLIFARDTMIAASRVGIHKAMAISMAITCLAGLLFLAVNRKNLKEIILDRRMLVVLISAVVIAVPMLAKQDWQAMYGSILFCILFAVFLSYFVTMAETAKVYVLAISALALYSLIATYIVKTMMRYQLISLMPTFYNVNGLEFFDFGLCSVDRIWRDNRNWGVFREPGVYQYFLIVALYLTNYKVAWKKSWHMWVNNAILAVTMVSTISTGGVVELFLLAGVMFFDKKWYRNKFLRYVAISCVVAVSATILFSVLTESFLYRYLNLLFGKVFRMTGSTTSRMEAIFVDFQLFISNPVFGGKLANVLHAVKHNTTSTLLLFAIFGTVGGLFHVGTWVTLVWEKEKNLLLNLCLLAIMFMAFNSQNLIADTFFWLFPIMALTERVVPWLEARKNQ